MNRRQKIIVSVTGIFIVLLVLLGLTYAYFLTRITGNGNPTSISVSTANLELVYGDGTVNIISSPTPIEPGKFEASKDFTVTNNGDVLTEYAVTLEDFSITYANDTVIDGVSVASGTVTKMEYPEDMKMEITCTIESDDEIRNGRKCGSKDGTLPTENSILLTNSIEVDDIHKYVLTLTYIDSGIDQSKDMNKTIKGKIDIIDPKSTIDLTGTVATYQTGDYVEINSTPIKSEIVDGKYKIIGVEPGNHTLHVKYKDENGEVQTRGSQSLIIKKGTEASVSGNTITFSEDSIEAIVDIGVNYELIINETLKSTNLFSFENADKNFSWYYKGAGADKEYIYATSKEYGYKDTENNYFVSLKSISDGAWAITGGIDNPLSAGIYELTGEVFIPSETATEKMVSFGAVTPPSNEKQYSYYYNLKFDTWVELSTTIEIKEGDIIYVIFGSAGAGYPVYLRNIELKAKTREASVLYGKKWAVLGDSLTAKHESTTKNYYEYIYDETGVSILDYGVSGTGYMSIGSSNKPFYSQALNVNSSVDVVTIFGSGNDLSDSIWNNGLGLGTITDTETDTICGCINTTIDTLYSIMPNVKVGIITPTPWTNYDYTNSENKMALYNKALIEICELRGIPYLDLYNNSGLVSENGEFFEYLYNDNAHPNAEGHALIASKIQAFLEEILEN